MFSRFKKRSNKPERIDTGDYTEDEYDRFLKEIRLINRYAGDRRALKNSLLAEIERKDLREFSVLDVGAGSGELLRVCGEFSRRTGKSAKLCGLELSKTAAGTILESSRGAYEITAVCGDVLQLPFARNSFDYVICSLFTHHFTDDQITEILRNISHAARRKIFVIDLHRHPAAYGSFRAITKLLMISKLVRDDGALSVLRGFKPRELEELALRSGLRDLKVRRSFPFRLILESGV
ncbi:MAG: methyltransferase domain-containing protein [Pyrinomonadaceae bacterium]